MIDDDAAAEFAGLQNYISEISPDSKVDSYLNQDEDAVISVSTVNIGSSQSDFSPVADLNSFCLRLGDAALVSALTLVLRWFETLGLKNIS